ncbi:MAG: hypothetical protein WC505_06740 [Patescibacteria group bacterium]
MSRQSKLDMTRSYFQRREEFALTAATNLVEEGQLAAMGGTVGREVTTTGGLAVTEVPAGVMLLGYIDANTFSYCESGTVPASLSYTLKFNNLVVNPYTTPLVDAFVAINSTGLEIPVVAPAPANGQVSIAGATGVMTFAALQAGGALSMVGVVFTVRYRWTLTTVQAREIVRQSAIGRGSEGTYRKAIVGRGDGCRCFTTTYDADGVWELNRQDGAAGSPVLGAGGVWTTFTNNNNGTPFGRVVSLPSVNDPYLGMEFTTP